MFFRDRQCSRRKFLAALGAIATTATFSSLDSISAQSIGTEPEKPEGADPRYAPVWTLPPQTLPAWARPGKIRFARWDGGALEAAKAILSGWPHFSPVDPDYLEVMVDWYKLGTIELLRQAHINLIWVTFSNGFSNQTEQPQQQLLRGFIKECHRFDIHVMAYESLTNIFAADMFQHVPESPRWLSLNAHGNPIPYNAANYKSVGRVTRYLADLANPAWLAYVRSRIDLAIAAGADGIMYDNCMGPALLDVIPGLMSYGFSRKPDLLVMANFHREQFVYNHMLNAITTEEGGEAGIFSGPIMSATNNRWQKERPDMLQVDDGFLANNLGRMRVFWNLSRGWKPCMIESRQREAAGMAETRIIAPRRQKLILAENLAFNCAYEPSVEIEFAQGLARNLPRATEAWKAIAAYNRFASENETCFLGADSCASIAIVLDNRSDGIAVLNGLAARNVQFDVLYQDQLTTTRLDRYEAIALLAAITVSDRALETLRSFLGEGGAVYVAQKSASRDETGRSRPLPSWLGSGSTAGRSVYWENLPAIDELAAEFASHRRRTSLQATVPGGVLYTVMHLAHPARFLIHLLNYAEHPSQACLFSAPFHVQSCRLLSPDAGEVSVKLEQDGAASTITLSHIEVYSLLVLELALPKP